MSAIILAAGSSSRMGRPKQLLAWKSETLLSHCVNVAKASNVVRVSVVLGANEATHRRLISDSEIRIISNPAWEKGIGSSIKAGMQEVNEDATDGVLLLVCDQPFLTTGHLNALIAALESDKGSIIASVYDNTNGVPALFGRDYFSALMNLRDDEGAKRIISEAQRVYGISFPDGGIDVDTPEDYDNAKGD